MTFYQNRHELAEKLKTKKSKELFNTLSNLGANWVLIDNGRALYLKPTIATTKIGTGVTRPIDDIWAKDLDEAVIKGYEEIVKTASKSRIHVVVNPYQKDRREFLYNRASGKFNPISR